MLFEYKGVKIGDDIKDILSKINSKNSFFELGVNYLIVFLAPYSERVGLESAAYIYVYTGKVVFIRIFEEDYILLNELKIGMELTEEIKEKYGFYYDEDDDDVYRSTKYRYLKLGVEYIEAHNSKGYIEKIFSFLFDGQDEKEEKYKWSSIKDYEGLDKINWLEKNELGDFYYLIKKNEFEEDRRIEVDIEKKEIIADLKEGKFIFDLITRKVKAIYKNGVKIK